MDGSADPSIMQADAFQLAAAPSALRGPTPVSATFTSAFDSSREDAGAGGAGGGDGGGDGGGVHDSGAWFGRFRNSDMERGMLMMKIRPLGSRTSVVVATAHLESPTDKTPPELRLAQLEPCLDLLGQGADACRDAIADEATDAHAEVGADEHDVYQGGEDGDGVGEPSGYRFRSSSISSEAENTAVSAGGEAGGEVGGESGADAVFLGDMNICSKEQAEARRVMAGRYEQTAHGACRSQHSHQQRLARMTTTRSH